MGLGETIYRLRTERNMSQEELAAVLEVSRQSVSKWETSNSVPELDKLIKMGRVFEVSIDELIFGNPPKKSPPPDIAELVPPPTQSESGRKIAALVLLSLSVLVWLVLTVLGSFLAGLLFALPFLLCGVVCLLFKRNIGLWCTWVLLFAVNLYLRFATGITWRLTLITPHFEPSMNYIRLAMAWIELACFMMVVAVTVLRFVKKPLEVTKCTVILLVCGWIMFGLTWIPVCSISDAPICFYIADWVRLGLVTILLTSTIRLIRTEMGQRNAAT